MLWDLSLICKLTELFRTNLFQLKLASLLSRCPIPTTKPAHNAYQTPIPTPRASSRCTSQSTNPNRAVGALGGRLPEGDVFSSTFSWAS
ncbi:hypothetical protein VTN96DRAFT_2360 [Rasamsonia emersonii]